MDNLLKRVLSLAVALVMVIGLMPWNAASVYATEELPTDAPAVEEDTTVEENETHASAHYAGADVEWKAWSGNREELYEGGYFCLTEDATLSGLVTTEHDPDRASSPVTGVGNLKVTICLHGHTLTGPNSRMFRLSGGADFTIVDCQGGGTLKPVKGNIQGKIAGFWSDDNGAPKAFNLYDVILDGSACSGTTVNGGVMSVGTKLTDGINIKGCTIKDFDALNGGVIYVNAEGNTFNIADTTITDCDAATDGGVFCTTKKQTLNMSGCTVSGSVAGNRGGAILGTTGSTITLTNCDFTDCHADNNIGGALYGNNVTYNVSGCDFTECSAYNGGAIYCNGNAKLNISDSTITGCVASNAGNTAGTGAAMYLWDATATIHNTAISDCNANRAAIMIQEDNGGTTTVTFSGTSSIKNCTSVLQGGAVRVSGGTFIMTGGEISGNTAAGTSAPAVNVQRYYSAATDTAAAVIKTGIFKMTGGTIYGNVGSTSASQVLLDTVNTEAYISGNATITSEGGNTFAFRVFTGKGYVSGNPVLTGRCSGRGTDGTVTIYGGTFTESYTSYVASSSSILNKVQNEGADHFSFMAVCNHAGESETITKEATCGEAGVKTVAECQYCGETNVEVDIAPLAHTVEHKDAVAPSCEAEGNIEYWYCTVCGAAWEDEAQTKVTNLKSVILPVAHNVVHVPESCYNVEHWYCEDCEIFWADEALMQITNSKNVIKAEPSHNIEHVAESCYNTEYWYCDICETYWADEALTQITNSKNVIKAEATHTLVHVEAVEGDCQTMGNIEYWYCEACETVWADEALTQITNMMSVKTGYGEHEYFYACDAYCMNCYELTNPDAAHNITHVEAKAGTDCQTWDGNIEYWTCSYCNGCWDNENATGMPLTMMSIKVPGDHVYFNDCDPICMVCGEETRTVSHNVIHVDAVEGDCQTMGNVEYWYCDVCGAAWLDEAQTQVTNLMSVKTGYGEHEYFYACDAYCMNCGELTNEEAAHNITHVEAKAGTDCQTWDGNIEYWTCSYCNSCWDNENATGMPLTMMSIKVPGDHKYENGVCSVCGEADPDYVEPIVKFDFSGSTMTLGNELVLNFVYNKALLTGTDNYAKVTIAREDGDYTYEIPQSEWTAFNASLNQIPVKVFAKEMTDEVTVVICNAAGQEVSNPRTGSVVAYCNNLFEKSNVQEDKAMAVDMLNYGAAAQIQFNYREETLANAGLTDELKALATVVTDMQDASVKGPGCAGNTLTLEDKILLNFVYQNATIDKAAYATVSYVDHYDQAVSYNIEAADFLTFNSSMKMVQINTLVVADCRTMVSVELFDAEGNSLGVSQNSVESYTARSGQELFKAILAFGDSAYAKFH